mmetsp:Transcript_49616/g.111488  ORF Transcript_49616/g.111488 Transcript_49616/m.111488 type:complete len:121 (+) Transcript_49616:573-935(+)
MVGALMTCREGGTAEEVLPTAGAIGTSPASPSSERARCELPSASWADRLAGADGARVSSGLAGGSKEEGLRSSDEELWPSIPRRLSAPPSMRMTLPHGVSVPAPSLSWRGLVVDALGSAL